MKYYLNTFTTHILRLAFLGSLLALALGLNYVLAWTGPTQSAPNGNVAAPLNSGTTAQAKTGGLSLGSGASTTLSLTTEGKTRMAGWLTVGDVATDPTQPIDIRGNTNKGIRFADGTIQTSASTAFNPNNPLALGSTLSVAGNTTMNSGLGFGGAPTYTIDLDPLNTTATNGIRFADGTVQTTAAAGGSPGSGYLMAVRSYTADATWTKPAGLSYVVVEVWGAGGGGLSGGGGGNSIDGSTGEASSFDTVSATGGTGATEGTVRVPGVGGAGSGGDINLTGSRGLAADGGSGDRSHPGAGGASPRGGGGGGGGYDGNQNGAAGSRPGGGGGGGGGAGGDSGSHPGYGGGGGGYAMKRINASSLAATESVVVGVGGAGGVKSGSSGGNGGGGMVIVYEYQ